MINIKRKVLKAGQAQATARRVHNYSCLAPCYIQFPPMCSHCIGHPSSARDHTPSSFSFHLYRIHITCPVAFYANGCISLLPSLAKGHQEISKWTWVCHQSLKHMEQHKYTKGYQNTNSMNGMLTNWTLNRSTYYFCRQNVPSFDKNNSNAVNI